MAKVFSDRSRPAIWNSPGGMVRPPGTSWLNADDSTPGKAFSRTIVRACRWTTASARSLHCALIRNVSTCSGSKPGEMCCIRSKLRMSSAAPTSSTIASAIWPATSAEREPDRDLLLAPHCVGQHETRDVAAGGEQHERDGAEKEPQRSAHAADLLFLHRHESRSPSAIGLRKLLAETRLNAVEIRLRLVDRDARLHPAERCVEPCRAYLQKTRRRPRGQPYLGALGRISKCSRHDADDRVDHAAEDQFAAGCRRVAVQP